ncbi:MAG: hypothetical protein LC098_04390 [Burkholderiales bacterium]|nr:hypothetical protein [Pseudomonadota bacterium]MCZ2134651.1 hypothetical protein [Burkholderiales bacterium]
MEQIRVSDEGREDAIPDSQARAASSASTWGATCAVQSATLPFLRGADSWRFDRGKGSRMVQGGFHARYNLALEGASMTGSERKMRPKSTSKCGKTIAQSQGAIFCLSIKVLRSHQRAS